MNSTKTSTSSEPGLAAGHNSDSESEEAPTQVPTNLSIKQEPGLHRNSTYNGKWNCGAFNIVCWFCIRYRAGLGYKVSVSA